MKFLYVNLGDNVPYTYDKIVGRVTNWADQGHEITILVPQISRSTIEREIAEHTTKNIQIITLPGTNWLSTSPLKIMIAYLFRLIVTPYAILNTRQKYDIVVSNSAFLVDIFPPIFLKLISRCKDWILIMDSIVPSPSSRQGNILINILTYFESIFVGKIASIFASCIFTVNPELKKQMVKRGIRANLIKISGNGLFVNNIDKVKSSIKSQFDAVYQGRITPNKGVIDLLYVWKSVVKKIPGATLAVMGSGLKENILNFEKKIIELRLENNIRYLGFTNRPRKYEVMKGGKLFIYLSKVNADESWGISLMEALACGLPAISYDLPIYNYIYKTDSLIKVKKNDLLAVEREVISILKDHKRRENFSKKSKDFSQKFSWKRIATNDLKMINDTIKNKAKQ